MKEGEAEAHNHEINDPVKRFLKALSSDGTSEAEADIESEDGVHHRHEVKQNNARKSMIVSNTGPPNTVSAMTIATIPGLDNAEKPDPDFSSKKSEKKGTKEEDVEGLPIHSDRLLK